MILALGAFGLLGLTLFLAPEWSAARFAWLVTPFIAMTLGGWCMGTGAYLWLIARHRRWNLIYPSLLYLAVFCAGQLFVVLQFRDKVRFESALTAPYLGALALGLLSSLSALAEFCLRRPQIADEGPRISDWMRYSMVFFVLFVGFLAVVALAGRPSGLNGRVFPEPMSLFTLHGFGMFYLALTVSVVPLLRAQRAAALTVHVWGGIALILPILAAALIRFAIFNIATHPLQALYLAAYGGALILAMAHVWSQRNVEPDVAVAVRSARM